MSCSTGCAKNIGASKSLMSEFFQVSIGCATISVIAIKFPYDGSCTATLNETVNVSVQSPPTILLQSTSNPTTCLSNDGIIQVSGLANNTT